MPFVEADVRKRIEYGERWAGFFLALDSDDSWDTQRIVAEARERDPDYYTDLMDIGLGMLQEQGLTPPADFLEVAKQFLAPSASDDDSLQKGIRIRISELS